MFRQDLTSDFPQHAALRESQNRYFSPQLEKIGYKIWAEGKALYVALFLSLTFLFVLNAWICDDAYVSFRVAYNFVHGHGLRWNIDERVQAISNPLWTLLLSGAILVSGLNVYWLSLALSFACLIGALAVICRHLSDPLLCTALVLLLGSSYCFMEYSSSGLENPLTYLLLAVFFVSYCTAYDTKKPANSLLGISAGLLILNRGDLAALVIPALISPFLWRLDRKSTLKSLLLAALPIGAWMVFSLVYYGFPFPNTYYAKLATTVERGKVFWEGLTYLLYSLRVDPVASICIALSVVFAVRSSKYCTFSVGIFCYLLGIAFVGGDFMTGRFLSAPAFLAVLVTIESQRRRASKITLSRALGAAIVINLFFTSVPSRVLDRHMKLPNSCIHNERYGFRDLTLANALKGEGIPYDRFQSIVTKTTYRVHDVFITSAAGLTGYLVGPRNFVIDKHALGDALMARLPHTSVPEQACFPAGHLTREIPSGYIETRATRKNEIEDKNIALYYDQLRRITRGPLFSAERWKAIYDFNLGRWRTFSQFQKSEAAQVRAVENSASLADKQA